MPDITLDRALRDKRLLGAALGGDLATWGTWTTGLKAAFALPLADAEREVFKAIAGERSLPTEQVRELWCVIGRGGGKSRIAGALAVYLALFIKHDLAPGEVGFVLALAASRDQAGVVFRYARSFLEESPVLRREIADITADEIKLKNGIHIAVHANTFRSIRGRALVGVIFDEISMWRDEASATPDIEVFRAVRPSLTRTGGLLVAISTPYRKTGLLHSKWRDHFGQDGDTLVVQGPSTLFNPTLSQADIDAEIAADSEGATSEWLATFRSDLAAFLDDGLIEAAIEHSRPLELPPRSGQYYYAFTDTSGGRHDHYTLAIGHLEGELFVCDAIKGQKPPFDPYETTRAYCALLREYHVSTVVGDRYGQEWVQRAFRDNGIGYRVSDKDKSKIYLEALPLFARARISIPDHPQLLRELRLLERATHRGGKDSVDHPRNGSDDYANALCGCAVLTAKPRYQGYADWMFDDKPKEEDNSEKVAEERRRVHLVRFYPQELRWMPFIG